MLSERTLSNNLVYRRSLGERNLGLVVGVRCESIAFCRFRFSQTKVGLN